MSVAHILNKEFDLKIREGERARGGWETSGDIIDHDSGKPLGRVYGWGRTNAAAQQEVTREAERWLLRDRRVR